MFVTVSVKPNALFNEAVATALIAVTARSACGGVSAIMTLNAHEFVLPEPSVAVTVTEFVPSAKVEPEGGAKLVDVPEQLSLIVGAG